MSKSIKKLKKEIKKLKDELHMYQIKDVVPKHQVDDIINDANAKTIQIKELEAKLKDYEDVYFKNPHDEMEKFLHSEMLKAKDENIIGYNKELLFANAKLSNAYIKALKKYGDGDTRDIMNMMDKYKEEAHKYHAKLIQIQETGRFLNKSLNELTSFANQFERRLKEIVT